MSNWIRGERAAGLNYNCWNKANPDANDRNLRAPFLLRFGPKYTTGGAVAAIADLKQRAGESVGSFMDRVKISVDMLHYNVTEANRNQAYRDAYTRLVPVSCCSPKRQQLEFFVPKKTKEKNLFRRRGGPRAHGGWSRDRGSGFWAIQKQYLEPLG